MSENIGDRIRKLRTQKGISQNKLAKLAGISQSGLSSIEKGLASPSASTIDLLAKSLGVAPGYLLDWERDPDDLDRAVIDQYPDFSPGKGYLPSREKSSHDSTHDSLWALRESLRRDPKRRLLFDAAANVSEKDIQTAVRLLDALKGNDEDGAD